MAVAATSASSLLKQAQTSVPDATFLRALQARADCVLGNSMDLFSRTDRQPEQTRQVIAGLRELGAVLEASKARTVEVQQQNAGTIQGRVEAINNSREGLRDAERARLDKTDRWQAVGCLPSGWIKHVKIRLGSEFATTAPFDILGYRGYRKAPEATPTFQADGQAFKGKVSHQRDDAGFADSMPGLSEVANSLNDLARFYESTAGLDPATAATVITASTLPTLLALKDAFSAMALVSSPPATILARRTMDERENFVGLPCPLLPSAADDGSAAQNPHIERTLESHEYQPPHLWLPAIPIPNPRNFNAQAVGLK
jgi:hypothetical protein